LYFSELANSYYKPVCSVRWFCYNRNDNIVLRWTS